MTRFKGFTLVELMVVVALFAIAATIAMPGFQSMIQNNRLTTTTNTLLAGLQLARNEAVTTRSSITVCGANAAQNDCASSTNWSNGLLIKQDSALIRVIPVEATGVSVASTTNNVLYNSNGTAASAATLTISDSRGSATQRTITVNVIGPSCSGNSCP